VPGVLYSMNNMHGLLSICHSTVYHVKRGRRQDLESSDLDGPLKAWSRRWRIFYLRDAVVGVPRGGLHANGFRLGRSVELDSGKVTTGQLTLPVPLDFARFVREDGNATNRKPFTVQHSDLSNQYAARG
jgi:hypothetical protein